MGITTGKSDMSILERYRPRRYADTYQGLNGMPVSEMVAQERAYDYSQNLVLIGPSGSGKTTLTRLRGARRSCANFLNDPVEPCGHCDNCKHCFAGHIGHLGGYREIDCATAGWRDTLKSVLDGGFLYHAVWGRDDHELPRIIALDELQRANFNLQESLLKTVEDTNRAQFIICSTDKTKILPELLNRCQILEMKRPTMEQYKAWLKRVLTAERITWDPSALDNLAHATNCGTRETLTQIRPLTRGTSHLAAAKISRSSTTLL